MNVCSWILCERGGRWAPALRFMLDQRVADRGVRHRVREVRHLAEIADELAEKPSSIVAIEVHRGNFSEALAWLAAAELRYPRATSIALADRTLQSPEVADAMREAGAVEVLRSPRGWLTAIELGRRFALARSNLPNEDAQYGPQSLTALAWAALPWQDA